MSKIASTPQPPYYSVIFTSKRTHGDNGYENTADEMVKHASRMTGFLGVESLRDESGFGITISYWSSLESIDQWRNNLDHMNAKQDGKAKWYSEYKIRICKVEQDNYFEQGQQM